MHPTTALGARAGSQRVAHGRISGRNELLRVAATRPCPAMARALVADAPGMAPVPRRAVAMASFWDGAADSGSSYDTMQSFSSVALETLCKDLAATWCRAPYMQHEAMRYQSYTIKNKHDWSLVVGGTVVCTPVGPPSVVICIAAACPGLETDEEGLSKLKVHWGCSEHAGWAWQPPPAGWHTAPAVSCDAGQCAWETRFKPVSPNDPVHMALLQLPLEGALAGDGGSGGISFVLKPDHDHWLRQENGNGGTDFFFSTAGLPDSGGTSTVASTATMAPQAVEFGANEPAFSW